MANIRKYWVIVGAIVAFILQAVIASAITIGYATPNFLLIYSLLVAAIRPDTKAVVLPFVLGLLYDLMGVSPIGAMALICLVFALAIAISQQLLHNDTLLIPIVLLVISMFLANIFYAILQIACGVDVTFLDAFVYRALPNGLYDAIFAAILFPIMVRLLSDEALPPSMNQQLTQL